jgi:hypothetical protein
MSTTSAIHLHPFDPSASVSREVHDEHPVENGNKQKHDHSSTDEIPRDLDRLATSIRWVQRAEAAARVLQSPKLSPSSGLAAIDASDHLPRAPQLPCVSGLIDAGDRSQLPSVSGLMDPGDRSYRTEILAPQSLKPERLMPPPTVYRGDMFWPISILMVLLLAAPIAYYLLVGRYGPISTSSDSISTAAPLRAHFQESQSTMFARHDALMARAEGEIPSAPCR